jgi:excisionase family DNA binding protein
MSEAVAAGPPHAAKAAAESLVDAARRLRDQPPPSGDAVSVVIGDLKLDVPVEAIDVLAASLVELAEGHAVQVVRIDDELTTQQAADLLNVSRPYVIKLIERGELPHRRVGNRRKVPVASVLAHKRRDDAYRREAARELTQLSQQDGDYFD